MKKLLLLLILALPPEKVYESYFTYFVEAVSRQAVPDNGPVDDICETCNGKGWVGDGTIRQTCPTCDGTGKKKRTEANYLWPPKSISLTAARGSVVNTQTSKDAPSVVMYSFDGCPPCEKFKKNDLPHLKGLLTPKNLRIYRVTNPNDTKILFPSFVLRSGNRVKVISGYVDHHKLLKELEGIKIKTPSMPEVIQ